MADANKLKELQKRISEQKLQLEKVKKMQTTETSPDRLVELDRTAAGIQNLIDMLERTYQIASYEPPQPTDMQILLMGVNAFVEKKQEKVQKVQDDINKAMQAQRAIESSLQEAVENGNADEVIRFSREKADLSEKLKYLYRMKEQTSVLRTFPEGAIVKEWKKVCHKKRKEWEALILRTETLAAEYRKACGELLEMNDFLLKVRAAMRRIGEENGEEVVRFPQILTAGLDVAPLTISKGDGLKPIQIMSGSLGKRPL